MTDRSAPKLQAMPTERSILWNPSLPGARPSGGRAPYPIFFQQEAVIALQEHLKSSPTQAIFGFLIGDVYRDPETGVLYIVIDKTLKLSQPIYGDKTEVVVSRLWDRMQQQLAKAAGSLLGWYHSHPGQGGYLTAHDVETHEKFFTDPWQVAVLVAAEAGGVTGKFFRASQDGDWHKTPQSFYELLQPDSIKPDGKKRSFITWRNHKAFGPSLKGPPPPKQAAAQAPPEPEPAEPEEEDEAATPEPPPPPRSPPPPAADAERGFRIMRSSADDIPVVRTSADDEPAPAPQPEPPPPPLPQPAPPPPPRRTVSTKRPTAPVFVPDEEPPAPQPPPQRSSDEIPWQVTPESVAAIPPEIAAPAPPAPRRTPTHTFRLLEPEAEKKPAPRPRRRRPRGYWKKRFVLLLVLVGIGAGAYWYVKIRNPAEPLPWAGLLDRAKKLVARVTAPSPAARRPAPRRTQSGNTQPAPAAPAAAPLAPPPPSPFARFDRLSDSLSRAVRSFQDRASLVAGGRMDCGGLSSGLVTIENLWITYNTERRARMAAFDPRRASQDQALYAAVDSVESRFEQSGCRRP